jgi:CheY-like chemotaxis protein
VPEYAGHPTILIAHEDREFRDVLTRELQQKGYLVLEARDPADVFAIGIRHSRDIHVLLADDSDDGRAMAARLKPYRRFMNVMHVSPSQEPGLILREVAKILEPAARLSEGSGAGSADSVRAALTAALEEARRRFLESSRDFLEATKNVPSGISYPDSAARLGPPGNARRRALDEYLRSRKRLDDHIAAADSRIKPKQGKKRKNN